MRIIIFISVLFVSLLSYGQIAFFKQYADAGADFGQGIVQLEDSSYLITGASSSFSNYQTQAFILKVDSLGNYLWSAAYGGGESDWGRRVLYQSGYGIYVCGYSNSFSGGDYDYYIFKTDLNGNLEWEKTYGGIGWDKVHDAALLSDTGVIMVGENSSNATDNKDIYLVRTDKNGDTLWTKTMGGAGHDWATSVKVYNDSMLVVGGSIYNEDSLKYKSFLAYLHGTSGDLLWMDTIGNYGNFNLNDFVIQDDTVAAVGVHYLDSADFLDIFYMKYKLLDTLLLSMINGDNSYQGDFSGRCITNYGNGNYFYLMYNINANFTFPGGEDCHIGRYSKYFGWAGQVAQIAHDDQDEPGQIIPTSDGGAIATGYSINGGFGGASVFLVKIGPNELYPTVVGITSYSNLVTINELFKDPEASVYPNPSNEDFTVRTNSESQYTYQVLNTMGQVIESGTFYGEKKMDASSLPNGTYLINLVNDKGNAAVYKLMVHH